MNGFPEHFKIRRARAEDVLPATELFVETLHDLVRRNGLPALPMTAESRLPLYTHLFDTGFFYVVTDERDGERDGQIVALANGILRGEASDSVKHWFLSGFWVRADLQKSGIGKPLLRHAWKESGEGVSARLDFCVSSVDYTAMANYFKLGMLPQTQLLTLGAPIENVKLKARGGAARLHVAPTSSLEPVLLSLDRELRGVSRRPDLDYIIRDGGRSYHVRRDGEESLLAGYFFIKDGMIGPVGWSREEDGEAVISLAIEEAIKSGKPKQEVRFMLPGVNHTALRVGLDAGLRLTGSSHLMASSPVGHLLRYLPSGGILF